MIEIPTCALLCVASYVIGLLSFLLAHETKSYLIEKELDDLEKEEHDKEEKSVYDCPLFISELEEKKEGKIIKKKKKKTFFNFFLI